MEDVELVIKIPEKLYKHIMSMQFYILGRSSGKTTLAIILAVIKNGTPLPKGHGDLKDVSELLTVTDIREDGSEVTYVLYDDIENADTIIEADREV